MIMKTSPDYSTYQPIGDKVLLVLSREDVNEMVVTDGGIIVPKDAALKHTPMRHSVVIATGPECKQVQVGDTVMWNVLNASPFPDGVNDLYFLPEGHLICVTKFAPSRP